MLLEKLQSLTNYNDTLLLKQKKNIKKVLLTTNYNIRPFKKDKTFGDNLLRINFESVKHN